MWGWVWLSETDMKDVSSPRHHRGREGGINSLSWWILERSGGINKFKYIGWCWGGPSGTDYSGENRSRHGDQEEAGTLE